ncbi:dynein light chain binding [Polyrhizophydium stewartii]|uniref:Dynein light chain binding n=1 Tax=Polyrhizophydium stewartii TaxID=2732419 RepID=A0ABR4N0C3_9FUNG
MGLPGTPAFSRYYNTSDSFPHSSDWEWADCFALEYCPERDMYLIEWQKHPGSRKWVKRLNLLFASENRDRFYKRIEHAIEQRSLAELESEYRERVSKQPLHNPAQLPSFLVIGAIEKIGRVVTKRDFPVLEKCLDELEKDYVFSIRRAEYHIKSKTERKVEQSTANSERFAALALAKSGADKEDASGALLNQVAVAARDLSDYMFSANSNMQKASIEILGALRAVLAEVTGFYCFHIELPCLYWLYSELIETLLSDIFDIRSRPVEADEPRCQSFLRLVNVIMETQLRNLVITGVKTFLQLFGVAVIESDRRSEPTPSCSLSLQKQHQLFVIQLTLCMHRDPLGEAMVISDLRAQTSICAHSLNAVVAYPDRQQLERSLETLLLLPKVSTTSVIPRIESVLYSASGAETVESYLRSLEANHNVLAEGLACIHSIIRYAWPRVDSLLERYREFEFLVRDDLTSLVSGSASLEELEAPVAALVKAQSDLQAVSPDAVDATPFVVDCAPIKRIFVSVAKSSLEAIQGSLSLQISTTCARLLHEYEAISERIALDPLTDAALWKKLQRSTDECCDDVAVHDAEFGAIKRVWEFMYRFSMHVSDEDSELYWQTFKWPSRMHQNLEAARLRLSASRAAIVNSILADKEYVETHIQFFESQVESFSAMSDVDATASMVEGVLAMRKSIDKASAMAQSVQEREGQIGCPTSAFGSLSRIEASFQSYETLWQLASTVRESLARWIDEYFVDLDSELMVSYVRGWNTTLWTLARSFVAMQGPRHVVERLKATVDEFCRNTSVITSLRNPALRERHWDRIAGVIGLTFSDFAGLRLRQVLDLDLELVQDIIADISNEASVEYRLETGLEKMRLELTSSDFVLSQFFCSDFLLIENHRELASLLHDQLIRSESLFQLALGTSVHTRFEQWVKKLQRAQELAHAWAELQDGFVRLHPALVEQGSASLIGQETSDLFSGVSKTIALVSDIVSKNRKFIIVIHRTDLLDIVQGALNRLKTIARSVAPLVDAKRSVCPRLFLISDDEVLEFLAASTIDRLSAGIRKLFTGVHGLGKGLFQMQFSAALTNASKRATAAYDLKQLRHTHTSSTGSPEQAASRSARSVGKDAALTTHDPSEQPLEHISSLVSTHGELLAFESPVQMSAKTEVVICDIETRMREALRDEIVAAFDAARASTSLLEMLDAKCCMQALLVSSQAVIQAQMDEAAANCDEAQLRDLRGRITKTVDGIAALQRLSSPAALRARREAFAGLLISMLDSLATELKQPGSASRQMRLTYDCNRASELRVCLGSAVVSRQIAYGYEYCGSSAGLIVTPGLSQTFSNIVSMIVHGGFPLLIGQEPTIIAEALLTARGFKFAKQLASRLDMFVRSLDACVGTRTRCGMSRLCHIIEHTTISNPSVGGQGEAEILARQLDEEFSPMLLLREEQSLSDLLKDIFGVVHFSMPVPRAEELGELQTHPITKPQIKLAADKLGLCATDYCIDKASVLIQCLQSGHSVVALVGRAMSGKSTCIALAKAALTAHAPNSAHLSIFEFAPNSVPVQRLVGSMSPDGWQDGAIDMLLRKGSAAARSARVEAGGAQSSAVRHSDDWKRKAGLAWLVFDGQIRSGWTDLLCEKLDWATSSARLGGGGAVCLRDVRLLLETSSLSCASPQTLTQTLVLFFEPRKLHSEHIAQSLLRRPPAVLEPLREFLMLVFRNMFMAAIQYAHPENTIRTLDAADERYKVEQIFRLLFALVDDIGSNGYGRLTDHEQLVWALASCLFSVIWVIGAQPTLAERTRFDSFVRGNLAASCARELERRLNLPDQALSVAVTLPAEGTVFDYQFDEKLLRWERWPGPRASIVPGLVSGLEDMVWTLDVTRVDRLARLYLRQKQHLLITGTDGVGKTLLGVNVCAKAAEEWADYDSQITTAPPGGAPLLMRYLRYFSSVCIDDSQEQRLTDILPGLTQQCRKVATLADFANLSKAFVRATVALCAKLRTSYPRTPKHPQFVFSMRDMKRILSVVGKRASLESELAPLVSLWTHAVQRVWCDRAPDQELESNLIRLAAEVVNSDWKEFLRDVFLSATRHELIAVYIDANSLSDQQREDVISMMNFGTVPDFVSSIATTEIKLAVYRVAQSRAERGSAVGSSGPENIADELEAWSNPAVFARFMRERIRVVLSVASQPRQLWQQQLADLATDVNVIHSRKWGKDTVRWHLRKHLSAGLIELEQTHENHVVAFLMDAASSAREIINHERQNTLSTIELRSDALMHSLDFFANEYTRRYVAQKDRLGKLSDTISTLHRRRDDLARSQADLQTWQRTAESLSGEIEDLLKRTEAKRLEREEATYNLKTQRQTQSNVRDELKHLQDAYTSEVERTLPTLYTATKAVDALQRSDIYELKGLEEPHEGVLLVMEAVMLLLRWEARATETRWEAARRMISDPNFQRNIARFDKDLVSAATVHEIERCAHHAEFDSSVVSASSKAAACLRAWVKALDKYHKTLFLLEPKKRQMYEVEARLASQTSIVNDTSAAIAACDSALLDMKRAFETLVQERSKAYAKVKEVDNFLSAAAPLADSMAPLSSALQAEFDSEMKRHSRLLDESLLAACTLTYLGACTEITRVITKKRWISALTKASSSATATQPDLNVYQSFSFAQFMISDRLCDTFLVIEQAPDELMLETALIAKHHSRFALLWDPHGLGPAWIRSVERENKIATLSRLDCDFDYQLVLCMQKGVRVIASIDDGEAPAIIESLLRSHCIARPGPGDAFSVLVQRGVRSEPVTVMPGFRLYITVTRDYRQVGWRAWMAHVASVRVSSSLNGNAQLLETLILRTRNLELANLRRQAAVESANRQSRKELLLTRGIDYIRQLQASDLSGGDLHRTVVDIEQQLSIIQRAEARDLQTAERLASACKWYSEVGSALAAIFDVCRRMEQIRFEYLAPLGLYCSLLEDRCKTFECEGTPDMRTFVEDFVQHLCACLAPAYSYPHRVVFLFSLARVVAELEALGRDSACRFPDSQLRFLINGAADARDIVAKKWHPDEFPDNPSGEWLDPALWRAVTELSHLPEFARFAMEFARYANRATTPVMEASWEEVGIAADPLRAPFPSKWEQQLNKAERLLVLKALRPDSVFRGLECYARHVLGRLAVDAAFPADLFAQRHRLTSAYIPAVVIVDGLEDPLQHILHLAAKRNMANMVTVFSYDADLSDLTDSVIADLVVRGRWAIFIADTLLQTNLESALVRLRRVLAAQPNSNPNMRIWIIAAPSTTLPASLAWALKLWYEDYRDHRAYFNEAFGAAEDSIIPYEFKPTAMYRNVLFNLCGFYATIRTRTATPQLAPQTPLDFQLSHMADSIRLLRKCFTHCGGTPEASSLAQWLGSCVADTAYVSQAVNCWDSRLLSILFGESVGIAWNTADIETLSKLLAIKPVYDSMARNELEKCHTAIRALPRGSDFDLVLFGAGGSAACAANLAASRAIIAGLAKCWVEHHPAPPQTIWDGWAAIQTFFVRVKERLDLLMASSVFGILPKRLPKGVHRSLDSLFGAVPLPAAASALTGQGSGGGAAIGAAPVGKGPGKYMDHLLRTNMSMYRDILVTIQASLARVIAALNGSEPLSPLTELVQ